MRLSYMHRKKWNPFKLPDISVFQVFELFSMASLAFLRCGLSYSRHFHKRERKKRISVQHKLVISKRTRKKWEISRVKWSFSPTALNRTQSKICRSVYISRGPMDGKHRMRIVYPKVCGSLLFWDNCDGIISISQEALEFKFNRCDCFPKSIYHRQILNSLAYSGV
jgi:hypothetical protein